MHKALLVVVAVAALFEGACTTADFKVVDALQLGMTRSEAKATIESFSFERETVLERPEPGWSDTDGTFTNLPGRALATERRLHSDVKYAEYYPVHHGLLGFGQLFLFYDDDGKLVEFYRRQVN